MSAIVLTAAYKKEPKGMKGYQWLKNGRRKMGSRESQAFMWWCQMCTPPGMWEELLYLWVICSDNVLCLDTWHNVLESCSQYTCIQKCTSLIHKCSWFWLENQHKFRSAQYDWYCICTSYSNVQWSMADYVLTSAQLECVFSVTEMLVFRIFPKFCVFL